MGKYKRQTKSERRRAKVETGIMARALGYAKSLGTGFMFWRGEPNPKKGRKER